MTLYINALHHNKKKIYIRNKIPYQCIIKHYIITPKMFIVINHSINIT